MPKSLHRLSCVLVLAMLAACSTRTHHGDWDDLSMQGKPQQDRPGLPSLPDRAAVAGTAMRGPAGTAMGHAAAQPDAWR